MACPPSPGSSGQEGRSGWPGADRPVVFVNHTMETFTPTQSGALATYIDACCHAAQTEGLDPWVITRSAPAATFGWPRTRCIDYPTLPSGRAAVFATRVQRRLTGWPVLRQATWARRVASQVHTVGADDGVLVLQNDPEVTVRLRSLLPRVRLIHLFQNQLPAREPFRGQLASAADAIAAVSDFTARWVEDHYGLRSGSVATVLSGVDAETFRPIGARDDPVTIGFVGRTGIEKAPDVLLEAAAILAEHRTDFAVQIIGSNHWDRFERDGYQDLLEELSRRLTDRGIEVRRPGHIGRAELPHWLARTSIHVVPSRWDEPFGLTTLEGMAAGNVVVATRTGGTPEVVGDAGFLVPPDDPETLAAVLGRLLSEPELRQDYSQRARRRAQSMTWRRTLQSLLALAPS